MNAQGWAWLGCLLAPLGLLTLWSLLVRAVRVVECAECMARAAQDRHGTDQEAPDAR